MELARNQLPAAVFFEQNLFHLNMKSAGYSSRHGDAAVNKTGDVLALP